jgi:chlorite dismutase
MEQTPPGSFIVYSFYRVTPAWLTLPKDEKGRAISEVVAKVEEAQGQLSVRTYSTLGLKRDADFLLWLISKELHPVQASTLR